MCMQTKNLEIKHADKLLLGNLLGHVTLLLQYSQAIQAEILSTPSWE